MHNKNARILIVDDEPANVELLERILSKHGYDQLESVTDSCDVVPLCAEAEPDLILLDLMMPKMDGYTVLSSLRVALEDRYLPVLVLTADSAPEARRRALLSGANDFVTKPFDKSEVLLRVQNLLDTRFLYRQLQEQNQSLEARVEERTRELLRANSELENANAQLEESQRAIEDSQLEVLKRLAQAAEFRDDDTGKHTQRVGEFSGLLAKAFGLSAEEVDAIRRAAPLHDVGKIGISDLILLKPGRLTPEELDVMKTHTTIGGNILSHGRSALIKTAERIALTHHERWDGNGYPNKLSGDEIPIEGRILAVVDVFDALTHERPYKKAWPIEEGVAEIKSNAGKQFDPDVVEAFMELPHEEIL